MISWFTKPLTGAVAQKAWQAGIGVGMVVTLVIMPTWFNYWIDVSRESNLLAHVRPQNIDLQKMVFEKRQEFRQQLAQDTSKK
jgi:hypothetical protein